MAAESEIELDTPRPFRRNLNWDALKAIMLLILSVNHTKNFFPALSPALAGFSAPFGYFSMFYPFVLISGMTTGMSLAASRSLKEGRNRLVSRIKTIYLVHLALIILTLFLATINPDQFSILGNDNITQFAADPSTYAIATALMIFSTPVMDVLPVYILLLLVAAVFAPALRSWQSMTGLLLLSFLAWFALQFNVPGEGILFNNFRQQNPIGFQFLFVIGLVYGTLRQQGKLELSPKWRRRVRILDLTCIAVIFFFFVVRHSLVDTQLSPKFASPLFFPNGQLPIGIVINTLAFARVIGLLSKYNYGNWPVLSMAGRYIGRNSLTIFGWHITTFYILLSCLSPISKLSAGMQSVIFLSVFVSYALPLLAKEKVLPWLSTWWSTLRRSNSEQLTTWLSLPAGTRRILVFCALLPVLYLPGFGIEYREIKIVAFWCMAATLAWQFPSVASSIQLAQSNRLTLLPLALLGICLVSIVGATNFGLAIERTALWIAAFMFLLTGLESKHLKVQHLALAISMPLLVAAFTILLRTYGGIVIAPVGAGLGGLIGERNSAAIFMAASLPILLSWHPTLLPSKAGRALLISFLTTILLCILISRCRTAWLIIAFQISCSALLCIRTGRERAPWASLLKTQCMSLSIAITLLLSLPQQLHWSSPTPYSDTLGRLLSPEFSNGRIELWQVGWQMIKSAPLLGVGIGNYVVEARPFIPLSGVNPLVFGFLRNDLPLFNDYLQAFVETGILGGSLFLMLLLLIPCRFLWRTFHHSSKAQLPSTLSLISCISIAAAGMFDYPLIRCETLLLISLQGGILVRSFTQLSGAASAWHKLALRVTASCLLMLTLLYGSSFALRKLYRLNNELSLLKTAFVFWPWDSQWSPFYATRFQSSGATSFANLYVSSRIEDWPHDPTSYLAKAELLQARGENNEALIYYSKALYENKGGRCNHATVYALSRLRGDANHPLSEYAKNLLGQCP